MPVSIATNLGVDTYENESDIRKLVDAAIDNYLNASNKRLVDVILPNSRIVIKPNLVMDKNGNNDVLNKPLDCFITSWTVIFALLDRLNEIPNLDITIAECPMQWCDIDKLVTEDIKKKLECVYKYSEVKFLDLRTYKYIKDSEGHLVDIKTAEKSETVNIALNEMSVLPKSKKKTSKFRIMDYPLKGMKKYHDGSKHVYQFDTVYLDCDYIISIPKLKTHMKAGMTGAMKNFVGAISDKQCIPHHSKGSVIQGGDCYERFAIDKAIGEAIYDLSYMMIESSPKLYDKIRKITSKGIIGIRKKVGADDNISGSWYGNKTLPCAIVDINRAIVYGGMDGRLHTTPQRQIITLMDCIVMGEGNGPLAPAPHAMGTVIFSDNCAMADMVAASLIGFNYRSINYLKEEHLCGKYPLINNDDNILFNGEAIDFDNIQFKSIINAKPAKYWKGYIENE